MRRLVGDVEAGSVVVVVVVAVVLVVSVLYGRLGREGFAPPPNGGVTLFRAIEEGNNGKEQFTLVTKTSSGTLAMPRIHPPPSTLVAQC